MPTQLHVLQKHVPTLIYVSWGITFFNIYNLQVMKV